MRPTLAGSPPPTPGGTGLPALAAAGEDIVTAAPAGIPPAPRLGSRARLSFPAPRRAAFEARGGPASAPALPRPSGPDARAAAGSAPARQGRVRAPAAAGKPRPAPSLSPPSFHHST